MLKSVRYRITPENTVVIDFETVDACDRLRFGLDFFRHGANKVESIIIEAVREDGRKTPWQGQWVHPLPAEGAPWSMGTYQEDED